MASTTPTSFESSPTLVDDGRKSSLDSSSSSLWWYHKRPHDDHEDDVTEQNVWKEDEFHSASDVLWRYGLDDENKSNSQLYTEPKVHAWMQKIAQISKGTYFPIVKEWRTGPLLLLPFMVDGLGYEYQISVGPGSGSIPIIREINCPKLTPGRQPMAAALCELRYRSPDRNTALQPPTVVLHLGVLYIKYQRGECTVLERTDYSVVVDSHSTKMPVWLVAPSMQLRARPSNVPLKPIFNGLLDSLSDDEERYYDVACILDSVRRIAIPPSEAGAPNLEESCELIMRSRAKVDPEAIRQPRERLREHVEEQWLPPPDY